MKDARDLMLIITNTEVLESRVTRGHAYAEPLYASCNVVV